MEREAEASDMTTGADDIESEPAIKRSVWLSLGIVAFTAIAVRVLYLVGFSESPFFEFFFLDPRWHHQWAMDIIRGDGFGDVPYIRAPLYPYFLALVYTIGGVNIWSPRIAQFALGVLSSVFVYLIGRKLLGRENLAIISGCIFAIYGPMIYFEGALLIPSIIVFMDLVAMWLLLIALEKKTWISFALCGALMGLSAVARPNIIIPFIGILLWVAFYDASVPLRDRLRMRVLPLLLAASIFPCAATIPVVSVCLNPKGLPIASMKSPIRTESELPRGATA